MIDALTGNPAARALGVALLQFVWQGAVLGAATALALRALGRRSANVRYVVACLGLLSMLVAPIVTAASGSAAGSAVRADLVLGPHDPGADGATVMAAQRTDPEDLAGSISRWNHGLVERGAPLVVAVWACGVLLLTLQLAGSWLVVERIRRSVTRPLPGFSDGCLRVLAARLQVTRALRVAVSSRVDVPTVIGWIRPLILVPSSALAGLSPFQLEAIIAHEIAHVRRHDYAVNVLQSLVETLLFYHPAVWWVSKQVRLEREHCCDDVAAEACGDRVAYARALASLEELRAGAPRLVLAANGGDLVTRIRRLLGRPQAATPQSTWMVIGLAAATMSFVFAGAHVGRASALAAGASTAAVSPPDERAPASRSLAAAAASLPSSSLAGAATGGAAPSQTAVNQEQRGRTTAANPPPSPEQQQVTEAEGQLRAAVLRNDVAALSSLLADEYVGTNQNGTTRNRAQALELWRTFQMSSLSPSISDVRIGKGLAIVTGSAVEISATGTDRMLFTRVWRKDEGGWWKLASSSQFRDPRIFTTALDNGEPPPPPPPPPPGPGGLVRPQGLAPSSVVADPAAAGILRIGGDIKEPRKLTDVKPVYPSNALAARVQGVVILELVIDEQGGVSQGRVLRSVPLLDQAAVDAVKQWRFTPTLLNGAPVQVVMTVTVNFTLPPQ